MVCEKKECTGCFACYNICPKNAIEMYEDECGYIYPKINKDKCIECNLCRKICPARNKIELKYPQKCYAAKSKNNEILKSSTSGGIATLLSKKIIENNGVVYGAAFTNECNVEHIRVDNIKDLSYLQGSKYVHSYINDMYKKVKEDLTDKKKVLFIGTPCQIAGLKKFLMKEYENLYLIDLICHGVPSQKYLKDEVKRLNSDLKIDRVNFRDKKFEDFTFCINKNEKIKYSQEWQKNPYFYTFMNSITYRENCYNCKYASINRASDMTIGDFWGLNEKSKFYENRNEGVSVLLPITEKGLNLINMIHDEIEIEERDIEEAINGNDQLRKPAIAKNETYYFRKIYSKKKDFFQTYKKVCYKHYYKQKLKTNSLIKYILKFRKRRKVEK